MTTFGKLTKMLIPAVHAGHAKRQQEEEEEEDTQEEDKQQSKKMKKSMQCVSMQSVHDYS